MQRQRSLLFLIVFLVISAIAVLAIPPFRLPLKLGLDLRGGSQLTIQVKLPETIKNPEEKKFKLDSVKTVIDNRINALGVSEPLVSTVGEDQILVQLPGVSDPQEAERVLGGTAELDFRQENFEQRALASVRQQELAQLLVKQEEIEKKGDQAAIAQLKTQIAAKEKEFTEVSEKLFDKTELTGKYLRAANPAPSPAGDGWVVTLQFDDKGGKLFADLSKKAATDGTRLGIFLDNKLISAPVVGAQYKDTGIAGGQAEISGTFDSKSARELALQLQGGALPVPVQIVENRTIGASLGKDSIQSSIYAGVGGLTLVFIFMVWYYRLPGMIANIALIIYALLTMAAFALLGVTLTLPGIAGFILSIGMAVDANVLIFERTREELRAGKSLYRSVESGFYRAFSSILDSNVTTWIACFFLYILGGSGLVKGFAVTLALGVAVSMFTAVTCSRTLMFLAISINNLRKPELYCPNLPTVNKAEVAQ
ncbi:protein translocase subunit SecD [Calothrix sp. 336/3]|uniref:protein translocase subunit SecD n=1 Tax=Calothrix sp. 336/3 TaxID=1337936 RepID=UPI0004E39B28|nr:protein translocase subunit SecD [Calothrix sp. 336/3]AKG24785.1 preprotein translocase subunit SecD [Calothrix sp. 336/3]